MQQMNASFMFPLVSGTTFGIVVASFTFNSIMAMMLAGVRVATFDIPFLWLIGTGIVLAIVSYAIILIITGRIRKISAYDLVR